MDDLAPEQKQALQQEEFLQEVLRIRGYVPAKDATKDDPKPPAPPHWMTFLQSSAGAALITVLLGTLAGSFISFTLQEHAKERDLQTASYNDSLKAQREAYNDAFVLVGKAMTSADDLGTLTTSPFILRPGEIYTAAQQQTMARQRQDIIASYNVVDGQWRQKRVTIGLLLQYSHNNAPAVRDAWKSMSTAVTEYMDCERAFAFHQIQLNLPADPAQVTAACQTARDAFTNSQEPLFKSLQESESAGLNHGQRTHTFWRYLFG